MEEDLFGGLPKRVVWTEQEWGLAHAVASRLFNPSSPIDETRLFSGRLSQVSDLLGVVYERGAHAILFGERGVGKSSLANIIAAKIPPAVTIIGSAAPRVVVNRVDGRSSANDPNNRDARLPFWGSLCPT